VAANAAAMRWAPGRSSMARCTAARSRAGWSLDAGGVDVAGGHDNVEWVDFRCQRAPTGRGRCLAGGCLAQVTSTIKPVRPLSPFYLRFGNEPLQHGLRAVGALSVLAVSLALVVVGGVMFARRDLARHSG
jgi:hypothetical protein